VASRPLRVEELAEFLAFDFKAGPIPKFHEDWRLKDPANEVLSTSSSLLSIVNVGGSSVIQFSHISVKEFLTSTRLAETSDIITRRFHISMTPAHTLAAQACLGILLHLDKNITRDGLQKFPLAKYASRYWVDHARFENVLPNVEHGMKHLFDPNKPHLAIWVWIHDFSHAWHTTEQGETPSHPSGSSLHYAAHCGLHTMVRYLIIERSLDVNSRGFRKKSTPLHRASAMGHVEVVRTLLEHGADMTAQNEDGSTPLHRASRRGCVEVLRVLLEHGADATAQDKNRSTPLHQASIAGHVDSMRILLQYGVDATAQDKNGWTPLHLASYEGHVKVTRFLLEHGVDATVQDKNGRTPLHRAAFEGHSEITSVFLEHGVDATAQEEDGRTLLHRASFGGHVKVVRILLEHGTDAKVQDKKGWTPLHYASREGHLEVVQVLLERGADATIKDKNGRIPSKLAFQKGHKEVARILSEHDKDMTASASASASASTTDDSSANTSRERRPRKKHSQSATLTKEPVSRNVEVSDFFDAMRVLGKGRTGTVLLVRHKSSSNLYALKVNTKRNLLTDQELQHTLTEQAVLRRMAAEGTDPFVVKLWWSFHDKEKLFMVMVRMPCIRMHCLQMLVLTCIVIGLPPWW